MKEVRLKKDFNQGMSFEEIGEWVTQSLKDCSNKNAIIKSVYFDVMGKAEFVVLVEEE